MDMVQRLTRDLTKASATLSPDEARFLVDYYYISQRDRIRAGNQVRALNESGEPHSVIGWLSDQSEILEAQIRRALGAYAAASPVGQWSLSIMGIGPVIAAGLLAHIDIEKAPTVGHIWRFAGLDPTVRWGRSQKRPWNASLKTLCWKIGESFVKVKNREEDIYGKIYEQRKAFEHAKNDRSEYATQASEILAARPTHAQRETYAAGQLPDGHLHARAKRYAVKLFLSHWHSIAYRAHFNAEPPLPYPIAHLGHTHQIQPPAG
jgi:hypothetical protein